MRPPSVRTIRSRAKLRPRGLLKMYFGGRYIWLMTTLLVLLIIGPLVGTIEVLAQSLYVGDFVLVLLLLAAVRTFFDSRKHFVRCLALAFFALLFGVVTRTAGDDIRTGVAVAGHVTEAVLLLYLVLLISSDIFTTEEVDADTICGSITVYLLVAGIFAVGYTIILQLDPNAFRIPDDIAAKDASLGPDRLMSYFSLVTITTLGYGDITPRSEFARSLANLESLLGQIYLTVLVARLVGRHLSARARGETVDPVADPPVAPAVDPAGEASAEGV